METLIENVRIVGPDKILKGQALLIRDGLIARIARPDSFDRASLNRVIDGKDHYLCPGFIDIHNHGNSGWDIMDASQEGLDAMADFHLRQGVTSFLGTVITSSYREITRAIDNMLAYENKMNRSNLIGIHLEGPFFSLEKKGAQPKEFIRAIDLDFIKGIYSRAQGRLKMVSLAPELEGAEELIDYLGERGVKSALGHSMAKYKETKRAIDQGATIATHLYNGMRAFDHREPGIVGACLLDERVYCELICDRKHLHDGAIALAYRLKGPERLIVVSDAMMAAGLVDGDYSLGGQKVQVGKGEARLLDGNLAGSVLGLDRAIYNLVNYLDIDLVDAVRMASLTPAEALGIDKMKGSIELGKDADLVLIDRDINIYNIILRGNLICLER